MIVLDEQLLGRGLEPDIAQWYRGTVRFITDLRPHTIIKDKAIPALLRQRSQSTFATIKTETFGGKLRQTSGIASCALSCLMHEPVKSHPP
jgi:hypothetical protein